MIDFKATQSTNDKVDFLNERGEVVKSYPITDLDLFVYNNSLNITYNNSTNPNQEDEVIEIGIEKYIDDNWFYVTELFYKDMNKSEFQANGTPQKTHSQLSK